MGKNAVVSIDYEGLTVFFTEDAWFNATPVADRFGKRVVDWLENQETQAYIEAMARYLNLPNSAHLIRTKRGRNGGTWLHPKLGIAFARWLLPDFGVWLDVKIDSLLKGQHPHFDWKRQRHEAASSFKVMNDILATVRADQGKPTASHHYINEARLVNWALAGEFKGMDRDAHGGSSPSRHRTQPAHQESSLQAVARARLALACHQHSREWLPGVPQ